MASLDQAEGEALELGALLLIVIIIVAIVLFYMGSKSLLNELLKWLKALEAFLAKLLSGGGKAFLGKGGGNTTGPAVEDSNPLFQIPDIPLAQISGLGGDVYPLPNVDIPEANAGSDDFSDSPGVGVVSMTGVQ